MRLIKSIITGVFMLMLAGQHAVADVQLQEAKNLQADSAVASERKLPMLVLFSSSYCGYCTIVREDFLKPMLRSGDYDDKVIIRVVNIDSSDGLRNFEGKHMDAEAFADSRGVFVTPTVKFFGPDGYETASDLVGLLTVDYYGAYLDAAIEESLVRLRGDTKHAAKTH